MHKEPLLKYYHQYCEQIPWARLILLDSLFDIVIGLNIILS